MQLTRGLLTTGLVWVRAMIWWQAKSVDAFGQCTQEGSFTPDSNHACLFLVYFWTTRTSVFSQGFTSLSCPEKGGFYFLKNISYFPLIVLKGTGHMFSFCPKSENANRWALGVGGCWLYCGWLRNLFAPSKIPWNDDPRGSA